MIEAEIPHLRRYARALTGNQATADDLVQDTLERAWRKRHLWRPHGRLRSWLFRMLYRLFLDGYPTTSRDQNKLVPLEPAILEAGQYRDQDMLQLHCRDVFEAIEYLDAEHRAVLMLAALEQPSYRDGARMLGLRLGTYRSRLSRARQQLSNLLDDANESSSPQE